MKIVNLEAEINRTCQAICGCDRKDCKWTHFGPRYRPEEACTVIQRLEEAQPEDAIPVALLEALQAEYNRGSVMWWAIGIILDRWKKAGAKG